MSDSPNPANDADPPASDAEAMSPHPQLLPIEERGDDQPDPEMLALLDFEPVPRKFKKEGGWSADMQRLFVAKLAVHGSPGKACDELGKYRSGIDKVAKSAGAEGFRAAWRKRSSWPNGGARP